MTNDQALGIIAVDAVILFFYFIPTISAIRRKHHNKFAIFLLNIFLGWTFLGWIAALIWAATKPVQPVVIYSEQPTIGTHKLGPWDR